MRGMVGSTVAPLPPRLAEPWTTPVRTAWSRGRPWDVDSERPTLAHQVEVLKSLLSGRHLSAPPSLWITLTVRTVLVAALTKALLEAVAWAAGNRLAPVDAPLPVWVHGLMFLGFLGPGLWLLAAGARDRRAIYLGGFFVLIATAFARESGRRLGADLTAVPWLPIRLTLLQNLDAFLPLLLWLFATDFPRTSQDFRGRRSSRRAVSVVCVTAVTLSVVDLTHHLLHTWPGHFESTLTVLEVVGRGNAYWAITFGLTVAALCVILVRSRAASGIERVRTTWFALSLLVGLGPLLLEVIVESLSPAFVARVQGVRPLLGSILFVLCLTIPVTSTYAIVFKRVLTIRVVMRRALQCVLAKYVFVTASMSPLVAVAWRAYVHRHDTVVEVAKDPALRMLLLLSGAGLVGLVFAERILTRIDTIFFGPDYDARAVLTDIAPRLTRAADDFALAQILRRQIACLLRPFKVTVALVTPSGSDGPQASPDRLPSDSGLVDVMASLRSTDFEVSDRLLRSVSASDASWLAKTGAQLLVPMKASDGSVLGLIALAERSDDLPYAQEDRDLLARMAETGAVALDRQRLRDEVGLRRREPWDTEVAAFECDACAAVVPSSGPSACAYCGEPLVLSRVPLTLHGKFRVVRRLGRGGMGVVYLATDMTLDRHVALKTLSFTSAAAARRLKQEARTMAALKHPNLAAIYDYDTWSGRPILIAEYLDGGTLAARPREPRPSIAHVVSWVVELCDGLQCLHEHGLLHGDLKPSNVGFDRGGTPKLLDFGLTKTFQPAHVRSLESEEDPPHSPRWGTRHYLSPEAIQGARPSPRFDLWSLAVVLYETLAGHSLSGGEGAPPSSAPDIRAYRSEVSPELAEVLAAALHSDVERRPISALELGLWLNEARPIG